MSLWEITVAADGVRRANSPPKDRAGRAPTAEEHFAAVKRIEQYEAEHGAD